MKIQSWCTHPSMLMESRVKSCRPQNISGASQQNSVAAFSAAADGDADPPTCCILISTKQPRLMEMQVFFLNKKLQFWPEDGARWKVQQYECVFSFFPSFFFFFPFFSAVIHSKPQISTSWCLASRPALALHTLQQIGKYSFHSEKVNSYVWKYYSLCCLNFSFNSGWKRDKTVFPKCQTLTIWSNFLLSGFEAFWLFKWNSRGKQRDVFQKTESHLTLLLISNLFHISDVYLAPLDRLQFTLETVSFMFTDVKGAACRGTEAPRKIQFMHPLSQTLKNCVVWQIENCHHQAVFCSHCGAQGKVKSDCM